MSDINKSPFVDGTCGTINEEEVSDVNMSGINNSKEVVDINKSPFVDSTCGTINSEVSDVNTLPIKGGTCGNNSEEVSDVNTIPVKDSTRGLISKTPVVDGKGCAQSWKVTSSPADASFTNSKRCVFNCIASFFSFNMHLSS